MRLSLTFINAALQAGNTQFSSNPAHRSTLTTDCANILEQVPLNLAQTTALIQKLAAYQQKQGHDKPIPHRTLADAIRENPDALLHPRSGIKGILSTHAQHSIQKSAKLRANLINDPTSPPQIILTCGDHTLVELLTPSHLQAESAELGHCVGTTHNAALLKQHSLTENDPEAAQYLHYAVNIRAGKSRIFSLRDANNTPLATIEYDTGTKTIGQISGKHDLPIVEDDSFCDALCACLFQLKKLIAIDEPIRNFLTETPPFAPDIPRIITRNGIQIWHPDIPTEDILQGTILLPEDIDATTVQALACHPMLILNISHLSNQQFNQLLPKNTKASLESDILDSLCLESLQEVGDIWAHNALSLQAPNLHHVRHVITPKALSLNMPSLQKAGKMEIHEVTAIDLPNLEQANALWISGAKTIKLSRLKQTAFIAMTNPDEIDIKSVKQINSVCWNNHLNLSLDEFRKAYAQAKGQKAPTSKPT